MDKDRILKIYADGKFMGEFKWSQRKSHRALFNLAGIEIRDAKTGKLKSKTKIQAEYEADLPESHER